MIRIVARLGKDALAVERDGKLYIVRKPLALEPGWEIAVVALETLLIKWGYELLQQPVVGEASNFRALAEDAIAAPVKK